VDHRERIIKTVFENISSAGAQSVEALFTADAIYEGSYTNARICGARAIADMLGVIIPAAISPFRQWLIGMVLSPDGRSAVVEYRSDGISRHSGVPYRKHYIGALCFSGEQISYWREYYDPALFANTLGPDFEELVSRLMREGGVQPKQGDRTVFN
jgi:ketosteroid isomerase-like protein